MTAFTEGIRPVGPLRWRGWTGAVADLWDATGEQGGRGHYASPDPRLVVVLSDDCPPIRLADRADGPTIGKVAFIPANCPVWSRITDSRPFRHLDLHLERTALERRLEDDPRALDHLILLDEHPRAERLAAMLAAEVEEPSYDDLVPESLAMALLGMVLPRSGPPRPSAPRGGLTPAQLHRVLDVMRAELHRKLSVAELAAAAGLSESWFAHAFRETTGVAPARYLTRLRVEATQEFLRRTPLSLSEVATATGFSDQSHLTRAFRDVTGTTPAAWRRNAFAGRIIAAGSDQGRQDRPRQA
ncbi:helix-turn-helix domain-containing protein [Rubellimicrobium roseum]|nr:AraC family transcriptional regulator [Rubellimicrobium roseum]